LPPGSNLLDERDKRVLQQAAVVGRVFWNGSVAALLNGEANELEEALRRLEERDLVRARLGTSISGQEEFAFKHILTRNVAYETLPRRSRGRSHANVAAWIEATAGERSGELVELLAHHYVEAHGSLARDPRTDSSRVETLRGRAFEYLLSAAADGVRRMVLEKARRLAEQALTLADGPLERARALEVLGEAYAADFRGDEAWSYLTGAIDTRLESVPDDRMAIADLCGRALEIPLRWTGTMLCLPEEDETRRYLDVGLAHLEPGDSEARVRLLAAHGFWAHGFATTPKSPQDRAEARQNAEEAAAMGLRMGLPELALAALDAVQSTYDDEGLHREALELAQHRLELSRSIRDAWELGDMFAMLSSAHYSVGSFAEAVQVGGEGFELALDENPIVALHCLSYRAAARFRTGDWNGAFEDLARTREILGPDRDPIRGAALPWSIAAFAHDVRGETAAADRCLAVTTRLEAGLAHAADHLSPWVARDTRPARQDRRGPRAAGRGARRSLPRQACRTAPCAVRARRAGRHLERSPRARSPGTGGGRVRRRPDARLRRRTARRRDRARVR
jgi:tetratricopeptide (TPR) repeat protein